MVRCNHLSHVFIFQSGEDDEEITSGEDGSVETLTLAEVNHVANDMIRNVMDVLGFVLFLTIPLGLASVVTKF